MSSKTKSKNSLQPKLRFSEFRGSGSWDVKNGNQLFDPISNKIHNSDLPILAITQEHGAIPRDMIDYNVSVTDKSIEGYKVVEVGDFIISLRSFQGGIEYSNYKGLCSPAYIILRKRNDVNSDFFKQYFKTDRFIKDLNKDIEGLRDGKMVSYNQFSNLLLPCSPNSDEQQKIADCLSSLDELIEAEWQKFNALKDQKKGLMQELFPAEGQSLPNFRFSEFKTAPEWKEKPLGNLLIRSPDYGVNAAAVAYSSNLPAYIRITDISEEGRFKPEKRASVAIQAEDDHYLEKGDIALTRTGASVGKSYKYREEDGKLVFAGFLIRIRPNPKKINTDFLFNYLSTKRYWDWVRVTSARSGQPGINGSEYASLLVPVPTLQKEQEKIANFLSSINDLIDNQNQKIDVLRDHKKGLMQQLFPAVSEAQE